MGNHAPQEPQIPMDSQARHEYSATRIEPFLDAKLEDSREEEELHIPLIDAELRGSQKEEEPHISPVDWDFHETHLQVEPLENYMLGGYHPVELGDVFEGRYKVIHKLGHGGFSTVWLAHDSLHRRYVALKILCAEVSAECPELKILDYLEQSNSDHSGRQYVAFLLDHFEVQGPNGVHLCLVSGVVGPSLLNLTSKDLQLRGSVARKLARQLVEAIAFLHSRGVCHGGRMARITRSTLALLTGEQI